MPNRADQSVKTRQRDRRKAINGYVLACGSALAGLGALTVMLIGGQLAILIAAAILTILIFLQIYLLVRGGEREAPDENHTIEAPIDISADLALEGVPILIVSVSKLGRVRSILGQKAFLAGLKLGGILDRVLPPEADAHETTLAAQPLSLVVTRYDTPSGQLVVLVPAGEDQTDVQNAVLERTNFFAGLGHDLKSPLNAVIGFADIMDAEIRGPMPEAYKDYPGLIRESGETLLRLVEDILGYARSEAGTLELDMAPMDLAASGESVMRQSQAIAEKAGVSLRLDGDAEVLAMCDASAVRRIWDNLVSNAIKYSATGDTVTLTSKIRDGQAVIQVSDTGAGMDADDLARIAKPFAQGRNAKGRSGTGLGLALVQRLAELHGGKVKIETAPGQGTSVTVYLPSLSETLKRAAE